MGTECALAIFMLFNLPCLELEFCAADGGSGASSRRTLQRDCKEFEKMQEMFVPCSRRYRYDCIVRTYPVGVDDPDDPLTRKCH